MASFLVEQDDLVLALFAGAPHASPLAPFMQRLLTKTQARRGLLLLSPVASDIGERPQILQFAAPRATADAPVDITRLMDLGLHPIGALRPDRIYALDEMLDYDQPEVMARQREALAVMGIRFARWLRIVPGAQTEAWILLTRETEDFSSAAVAILASTVPYLKAALALIAALGEERMQRGARRPCRARAARLKRTQAVYQHPDDEGGRRFGGSRPHRASLKSPTWQVRSSASPIFWAKPSSRVCGAWPRPCRSSPRARKMASPGA